MKNYVVVYKVVKMVFSAYDTKYFSVAADSRDPRILRTKRYALEYKLGEEVIPKDKRSLIFCFGTLMDAIEFRRKNFSARWQSCILACRGEIVNGPTFASRAWSQDDLELFWRWFDDPDELMRGKNAAWVKDYYREDNYQVSFALPRGTVFCSRLRPERVIVHGDE